MRTFGIRIMAVVQAAIAWYENGKFGGVCDEDIDLEKAVTALTDEDLQILKQGIK